MFQLILNSLPEVLRSFPGLLCNPEILILTEEALEGYRT